MISAGISSGVFAVFPVWYKLPLQVQHNMAKLSVCSSMYHIYDTQLKLTDTENDKATNKIEKTSKNNLTLRVFECLDGMSIILCCGNYWLPETQVSGFIHMYAVMKMVSNIEIIKHSMYFSTAVVAVINTPICSVPVMSGLFGIYNYFKNDQKWNRINRTIWHLSNSIVVTMAYLYR
tara:strand:- start:6743 stop:7273 length:531 start_codon:yes stop_codon:yes gene_type:complete